MIGKRFDKATEVQYWLQTTQPTIGEAVTVLTNCNANCIEATRPMKWGNIGFPPLARVKGVGRQQQQGELFHDLRLELNLGFVVQASQRT